MILIYLENVLKVVKYTNTMSKLVLMVCSKHKACLGNKDFSPDWGEHPNASLNLFPHPQPLSHLWERGEIILVPHEAFAVASLARLYPFFSQRARLS
jgi:hypothetical protein